MFFMKPDWFVERGVMKLCRLTSLQLSGRAEKKEEEEMGKKNKKKTVAGRLERAGADGEGEKKKKRKIDGERQSIRGGRRDAE